MKLCIDLCCGRKGFSAAFRDSPEWKVITVDINAKFNPTIVADVCELLKDKKFMALRPRVILTSPPCEHLSKATDWPTPGIYRALSIAGACLEIVAQMRPRYWGLENPRMSYLRWFIGEPTKRLRLNAFGYRTVKPTGLWGNIPLGLINDSPKVNPLGVTWANGPHHNGARRAEMPYGLSQAIKETISA